MSLLSLGLISFCMGFWKRWSAFVLNPTQDKEESETLLPAPPQPFLDNKSLLGQ